MADIMAVASREFSEKGLAGARIDEIAAADAYQQADDLLLLPAARRGCTVAVLEDRVPAMRAIESELHLPQTPAAGRRAAQAGRLHLRLPVGPTPTTSGW